MPLAVTVIIPTLQEAANIGPLLESLKTQKYEGDLEVLVVDGGSTDGTQELVRREFSARLLESERGVSRQRNHGGREARGELLIFMDADDRPGPHFVNQVAHSFQRMPFAVACPWFTTRGEGPLNALIYLGFNVGFWLGQSTLRMGSGVCLVTPRRVFQKVGGFREDLHLGEDICYLRQAAPLHGLHRHLLVPLITSGRRFTCIGRTRLLLFYLRITPALLLGNWTALKRIPYPAAPYADSPDGKPMSSETVEIK